uniref:Protein quiver n=1 Tax=Panagrolaimus sp. JU765 TaxID=591449 RepID=A0AC34PWD1_9BILA
MNASEIVGGSGIHPGFYLTSLLLSSIPLTSDCIDPPEYTDLAPVCDQGICVKVNYTTRHSGRTDVLRACQMRTIRCYSCTTMDADRLLSDVQDQNWRRWLENVRFVPNTEECNDNFAPEIALRSGVRSQECENGVCMKMWFREKNGNSQVWRSCIPNAQEQIRSDCTRITSSQGDMEVCTCDGNLCNKSALSSTNILLLFASVLWYLFC